MSLSEARVATKAATQVEHEVSITVTDDVDDPGYVSRGGHKLAGALDVFEPQGLMVAGRRASTRAPAPAASPTSCSVEGRRRWSRSTSATASWPGRCAATTGSSSHDRTNVRDLTLDLLGGDAVDLVVGDLSFISLGLVLEPLASVASPTADLVLMVKPQFEVGRERLGSGGVVRDPALRGEAVRTIAERAWALGLGTAGVTASPLPGPAGNVEYFLWLTAAAPAPEPRGDPAGSRGRTAVTLRPYERDA